MSVKIVVSVILYLGLTAPGPRGGILINTYTSSHNLFDQPQQVRILIKRTAKPKKQRQMGCTPGKMYVNGRYFCQTLEKPFKNAESFISSIHPGIYRARLVYSTSKMQWRIQLQPIGTYAYDKDPFIPGRKIRRVGIQIHPGTRPAHTRGCILVGMPGPNRCHLTQSRRTFNRLLDSYFGGCRRPDEGVKITVAIEASY